MLDTLHRRATEKENKSVEPLSSLAQKRQVQNVVPVHVGLEGE